MDNKKGWVLSNNEKGDFVIQKDDESTRFKNDDEATEFVVNSYAQLLEALKELTDVVFSLCTSKRQDDVLWEAQQAINKAERG